MRGFVFSTMMLTVMAVALGVGPAFGACHYSGMQYSEGAPLRIGENIYACSQTGIWLKLQKETNSNCFYGNGLYTQGAQVQVAGSKVLTCQTDGTWE